jgi:arsenate reductase-like glutaredoxin family protein
MNTYFYLANCDSCRKYLPRVKTYLNIQLREIKTSPITEEELNELIKLSGNVEYIFSKKSRNFAPYRNEKLDAEKLKSLILSDYTFIRRPLLVYEGKVYIGNSLEEVLF